MYRSSARLADKAKTTATASFISMECGAICQLMPVARGNKGRRDEDHGPPQQRAMHGLTNAEDFSHLSDLSTEYGVLTRYSKQIEGFFINYKGGWSGQNVRPVEKSGRASKMIKGNEDELANARRRCRAFSVAIQADPILHQG